MKKIFNNREMISSMLNIFIFLFIFNMINREFSIIDIRYILIAIGIYLILSKAYRIIKKEDKLKLNSKNYIAILFCLILLLSNINWMYNDLSIGKDFLQYNILFFFNVISIFTFILYKDQVIIKNIFKSIIISSVILFISMILTISGVQLMGEEYPGIVRGYEHINFLGLEFRVAGYAEDANYATMFMTICLVTVLYFYENKYTKYIFSLMAIIGIMLSASKTVLLGIMVALFFIVVLKSKNLILKRSYNTLKNLLIFGICIGPYIAINLISAMNFNANLPTLDNRFLMWKNAVDLFHESPLFGSGLTSFRTYFYQSVGDWYVQSHSTQFQILSEAGIFALILFGLFFYYLLKSSNWYVVFITVVSLVFSVTTEINHLALIVFILAVLPIIDEKQPKKNPIDANKVLFLINSLGNGGAERVVANSANKMADFGKDVTIITLNNNTDYEFNDKVKIISLNQKQDISTVMKLINIPINVFKINNIICKLENDSRFGLITSHLPIMHLTSRLLLIRDRIVFVLHNPHHHMDPNNSLIFKLLLRLQYNYMKVVAVSKGVEEELTKKYGVKCCNITTIYNPIDVQKIIKLSESKFDKQYKYFLFCGRLTKQKRPDILINAFHKGNFYKKYKLVLLGQGELMDDLKKQVKELGIENEVVFAGWKANVYEWMKNCEMMISTSDYEAFPMNLLEAFACSAKVVAIDCDFGPREILVNDFSKYLVKMNDMDLLIKAIDEALIYYPEQRVEQVLNFDSDIINKQYLKTYIEWIK